MALITFADKGIIDSLGLEDKAKKAAYYMIHKMDLHNGYVGMPRYARSYWTRTSAQQARAALMDAKLIRQVRAGNNFLGVSKYKLQGDHTLDCVDSLFSPYRHIPISAELVDHQLILEKSSLEKSVWDYYNNRDTDREIYKWKYLRHVLRSFGDGRVSGSRTGRIFHAPNNVPRKYREYILLDGKPTVELDIGNSHPSFLAAISGDQEMIKVCGEKLFYETLMENITVKMTRESVKTQFLLAAYDWTKNRNRSIPVVAVMAKLFPVATAWLRAHNCRAISILQKVESDLILPLCLQLQGLSIHDGISVEHDKGQEALQLLQESLERHAIPAQVTITKPVPRLSDRKRDALRSYLETVPETNARMMTDAKLCAKSTALGWIRYAQREGWLERKNETVLITNVHSA